MIIAISGAAGASAAAPAAKQVQPQATPPPPPVAAATEDKVTISAAAQELPKPMSIQVRALHNQGKSVSQIATTLKLSPSAVQNYLGTPPRAAKA